MSKILTGILSFIPLTLLTLTALIQPTLMSSGVDRELVASAAEILRVTCGIVTLLTILIFIVYIYRSSDSRLETRKGLWTSLLLLGNVFAIPIFWFLYLNKGPKN